MDEEELGNEVLGDVDDAREESDILHSDDGVQDSTEEPSYDYSRDIDTLRDEVSDLKEQISGLMTSISTMVEAGATIVEQPAALADKPAEKYVYLEDLDYL